MSQESAENSVIHPPPIESSQLLENNESSLTIQDQDHESSLNNNNNNTYLRKYLFKWKTTLAETPEQLIENHLNVRSHGKERKAFLKKVQWLLVNRNLNQICVAFYKPKLQTWLSKRPFIQEGSVMPFPGPDHSMMRCRQELGSSWKCLYEPPGKSVNQEDFMSKMNALVSSWGRQVLHGRKLASILDEIDESNLQIMAVIKHLRELQYLEKTVRSDRTSQGTLDKRLKNQGQGEKIDTSNKRKHRRKMNAESREDDEENSKEEDEGENEYELDEDSRPNQNQNPPQKKLTPPKKALPIQEPKKPKESKEPREPKEASLVKKKLKKEPSIENRDFEDYKKTCVFYYKNREPLHVIQRFPEYKELLKRMEDSPLIQDKKLFRSWIDRGYCVGYPVWCGQTWEQLEKFWRGKKAYEFLIMLEKFLKEENLIEYNKFGSDGAVVKRSKSKDNFIDDSKIES